MAFETARVRLFLVSLATLCVFLFSARTVSAKPLPIFLDDYVGSLGDAALDGEPKVCLVVIDNRPESVQKVEMSGVVRGGIAFLSNAESLKTIVAFNVGKILQKAGFIVVKSYPGPPLALTTEPKKKPNGVKADIKAARATQQKEDRKDIKEIRKDGPANRSKATPFAVAKYTVKPQGSAGWTNGANLVLQIEIETFTSAVFQHFSTVEVRAWSKFGIVLAPGEEGSSDTTYFSEVAAWGTTGKKQVVGTKRWNRAVNEMHSVTLQEIETLLRSQEFTSLVGNVAGI